MATKPTTVPRWASASPSASTVTPPANVGSIPTWAAGPFTPGNLVLRSGNEYVAVSIAGTGTSTTGPTGTGTTTDNPGANQVVWGFVASVPTTQDSGFQPNTQPPAQYFNWLHYWTYQWILWLQDIAAQNFTAGGSNPVGPWTGPHTFNASISVNTAATNGTATTSTGNGTGSGVRGIGGASDGIGVKGEATNNGFGVLGTSTDNTAVVGQSTNGVGVLGSGGGTNPGVGGFSTGTGAGVEGYDNATAPGVRGVSTHGKPALEANSGGIAFTGTQTDSPAANVITNGLTAKMRATVQISGGACTVLEQTNLSGTPVIDPITNGITFAFNVDMATANYTWTWGLEEISGGVLPHTIFMPPSLKTVHQFAIQIWRTASGAVESGVHAGTWSGVVSLVVFGKQ